jgi:hypothetical protein
MTLVDRRDRDRIEQAASLVASTASFVGIEWALAELMAALHNLAMDDLARADPSTMAAQGRDRLTLETS